MKGYFMNNINKLIVTFAAFFAMHEVCTSEFKAPLKNAAHHVKQDVTALTRAGKRTADKLQKRLAKAKKRYEKKLNRLIAKNVSRAEREKNREIIKLKREIDTINNELSSLE